MEFRRISVLIYCLGFWVSAAGCKSAHSRFDPAADFSVYESYAWDPRLKTSESVMDRDFPAFIRIVEESMSTGLHARRLSPDKPENADLIVSYHIELAPYRDADDERI
jgi:hypothetical protein